MVNIILFKNKSTGCVDLARFRLFPSAKYRVSNVYLEGFEGTECSC